MARHNKSSSSMRERNARDVSLSTLSSPKMKFTLRTLHPTRADYQTYNPVDNLMDTLPGQNYIERNFYRLVTATCFNRNLVQSPIDAAPVSSLLDETIKLSQ